MQTCWDVSPTEQGWTLTRLDRARYVSLQKALEINPSAGSEDSFTFALRPPPTSKLSVKLFYFTCGQILRREFLSAKMDTFQMCKIQPDWPTLSQKKLQFWGKSGTPSVAGAGALPMDRMKFLWESFGGIITLFLHLSAIKCTKREFLTSRWWGWSSSFSISWASH